MPIATKDLGKYKKPGIYINEIDQSIIELPVQNTLINLVPGFSKRGPINTPTYVQNVSDFETIFGTIDRQLENKGSFFHRTCEQMLASGPIYALNLLATDDNRDKLQWSSVSVTADKYNLYTHGTDSRTSPYSMFFNRQDFWTRDPDSFLDMVDNTSYNPNAPDIE